MYEFVEYRVVDAMTYRPVTVSRQATLAEIEQLFERHDFNALPVTQDGALVGLVTKLDLLKAFAFTPRTMVPRYADIMQQRAEEVMNTRPLTVRQEEPLTRVLQLMVETRVKSFPVVIGALLLGIVAREDVLRALRRAAAGEPPRSAREEERWTRGASSAQWPSVSAPTSGVPKR